VRWQIPDKIRAAAGLDPLWLMLDLSRKARHDWYPQLDYGQEL